MSTIVSSITKEKSLHSPIAYKSKMDNNLDKNFPSSIPRFTRSISKNFISRIPSCSNIRSKETKSSVNSPAIWKSSSPTGKTTEPNVDLARRRSETVYNERQALLRQPTNNQKKFASTTNINNSKKTNSGLVGKMVLSLENKSREIPAQSPKKHQNLPSKAQTSFSKSHHIDNYILSSENIPSSNNRNVHITQPKEKLADTEKKLLSNKISNLERKVKSLENQLKTQLMLIDDLERINNELCDESANQLQSNLDLLNETEKQDEKISKLTVENTLIIQENQKQKILISSLKNQLKITKSQNTETTNGRNINTDVQLGIREIDDILLDISKAINLVPILAQNQNEPRNIAKKDNVYNKIMSVSKNLKPKSRERFSSDSVLNQLHSTLARAKKNLKNISNNKLKNQEKLQASEPHSSKSRYTNEHIDDYAKKDILMSNAKINSTSNTSHSGTDCKGVSFEQLFKIDNLEYVDINKNIETEGPCGKCLEKFRRVIRGIKITESEECKKCNGYICSIRALLVDNDFYRSDNMQLEKKLGDAIDDHNRLVDIFNMNRISV
ncbi:hypothetical protein BB558_004624 [Smittium angustum]|uniref:Uncharacterized protein n=1 Tax=Smittium angustum TaxID=133377 RepID=A0A2U1J2W6_SMIAN|nr:hypothetical protein BB558_004624 [Smittium angustum]